MQIKRLMLGAALAGAAFSGSAFAGATGNVGGVSEYMFRGISQGSGAAVQGGIDYAADSGFYVGLWGSNIGWGPGDVETDVYAGFAGKSGNIGYDIGAIYYYYPEEDQAGYTDTFPSANTIEAYIGVTFGPIGLKAYYTPKYFGAEDGGGDDVDGTYLLASAAFPVSETLNLTASVGYSLLGEEILTDGSDTTDDYIDYSVGLAKTVEGGYTATFAIVGTDLKDDDPKFVIGLKKVFDL